MTYTAQRLLTALALSVSSLVALAQEPRVIEDDALAAVAEALASCTRARATTTGLEEAHAALVAELADLRETKGQPFLLEYPADLARTVWLSRGYAKKKGKQGKVVTDTYTGGSFASGLKYAYRVPKDYDPKRTSYVLILAIPGEDETPEAHIRTHWSLRSIRDEAIVVCPEMPEDRAEWAQVMVAGRPGGLCHVLTALRMASDEFAVDPDRIHVAGRGKGVSAAVAAGNYSPQRFAGVIGRAGDMVEGATPENFGNLPTLFVGAGANARSFQEAATAAGFKNCELSSGGKEQDVWNWVQRQQRTTYPASVTLDVGNPFPTRAYWLRVAPTASDASATATIDRATNTIRINSHSVSFATIYLNDGLVDLSKPVIVRCNGVESTSRFERALSTTLDLLSSGTSDTGCVYVVEASFDMSGVEPAVQADAGGADDEFDERLRASRGDANEMWGLYLWCASTGRDVRGGRVMRQLLRLAPDHKEARATLGHEFHDGHWFQIGAALERYRASQDEESAARKGHVKHKSVWMHPDERALASKGAVKDPETGQWLSSADRRRLADGWARQDLAWISPEDAGHVDEGRWLVAGEWVELADANRRHSGLDAMWRIPSAQVLLHSSADRDVSLRAIANMDRAIADLRRVFGAEPVLPLSVCIVRDEEQFDRFAFGDPDGRRAASHVGRLQAVHYSFFAESWLPQAEGKRQFQGMGVGYWDPLVTYGDLYGVHSARLAVGLSYVDALDPSPKAVRGALGSGPKDDYYADYQSEKKLPSWLRMGAAVYGERFFRDELAAGDTDPWWARNWSLDNLRSRGGLRPLEEVFAFELDPGDRDDGLKLLIEAGLLVAFMVDGECAPVTKAHEKFKRDLIAGRLHAKQIQAVQDALADHEAELRAFAGL